MTTAERANRDRRVAELVADREAGTVYDIAAMFNLTGSAVVKIAARLGVRRGRVQWPTACNVEDCARRHHALGLCEFHYRRHLRGNSKTRASLRRNF